LSPVYSSDRLHSRDLHSHTTVLTLFFLSYAAHRHLHSFPTRRSSDLPARSAASPPAAAPTRRPSSSRSWSAPASARTTSIPAPADRKSTRLNSSHVKISYAVFCLKKKKKKHNITSTEVHIDMTNIEVT